MTLLNGGFEGEWREIDGIGELKVANSWYPWWHVTDRRPEFKLATPDIDPYRVHSGGAAQQWFTSYSTHTGGIYQQVAGVAPGCTLALSAWVQCFSRNDDTDWRHSAGRYRMRIGIDPYGGTNPESADVVWSETLQPYDSYVPLEVTATARSDRCTVFVWGQAEWGLKHNNAYVDDVVLTIGNVPEPPQPGEGITEAQCRAIVKEEVGALAEQIREGLAYTVGLLIE